MLCGVDPLLHWVSAAHAIDAEVRLYDRLFTKEDPEDVGPVTSPGESSVGTPVPGVRSEEVGKDRRAVRNDFMANINPHSLEVVTAKCEPAVAEAMAGRPSLKDAGSDVRYQFERLGYFTIDPDSGQSPTTGHRSPIFNRTITLKDTWAKIEKKQ